MFRSIWEDVLRVFTHGNMLNRLIWLNILVFVVIGVVFRYLIPGSYEIVLDYFALSSNLAWNLKHPWVFLTHMFLHDGIYHIFWNMLLYYWFGTILGDLVGDKKILPLFIYGGLAGAGLYLVSYHLILPSSFIGARAVGASAAVMATVVAAGVLAPDYKIRLILIGEISIKYIVIVLLLLDMIGASTNQNTGGHFAHLGGALFGWIFISMLKKGSDLSAGFNRAWDGLQARFLAGERRSSLKVAHKQRKRDTKSVDVRAAGKGGIHQAKLDEILDKINEKGYEQLTDEEKEFLFLASKKDK